MRLFVAIEIDASSFNEEIDVISKAVKCRARFVSPDVMHLTLKFLGEVSEQDLPKIKQALDSMENFGSLEITLSGLGAFPSAGQARVLWMGVLADELPKLAATVETLLKNKGPPSRFHGHLTLARIKERCNIKKLVEQYSGTVFHKFTADSIVLKESILMPTGPIYRTVHKVKL